MIICIYIQCFKNKKANTNIKDTLSKQDCEKLSTMFQYFYLSINDHRIYKVRSEIFTKAIVDHNRIVVLKMFAYFTWILFVLVWGENTLGEFQLFVHLYRIVGYIFFKKSNIRRRDNLIWQ